MYKETRTDVVVPIQGVQDKGIVAIAFIIIGNIRNCPDVYFQKMPRRPMTGLLSTS